MREHLEKHNELVKLVDLMDRQNPETSDDSPEREALIDQLSELWWKMTEEEREEARAYSISLYEQEDNKT